MDGFGAYIVSITAAALISGLLCGILEKGFGKELVKLLCGLFLTFAAIRPFLDISFPDISDWLRIYTEEAAYNAGIGEEMAVEAVCDIIKQETEAYILDRAADLNAAVSVDVTVEGNIPVAVTLEGSISPYAKAQLEGMLEEDLGITKENQLWI